MSFFFADSLFRTPFETGDFCVDAPLGEEETEFPREPVRELDAGLYDFAGVVGLFAGGLPESMEDLTVGLVFFTWLLVGVE